MTNLLADAMFERKQATRIVPVRSDAASVAAQLSGTAPLYYVLRQRTVAVLRSVAPEGTHEAALEGFAEKAWRERWYRLLVDGLEGVSKERHDHYLNGLLAQAKGYAS